MNLKNSVKIIMQNSIQIKIAVTSSDINDLLIAQLNELGCEGFEEEENSLLAYCPEPQFDEQALQGLIEQHALSYQKTFIEAQNWNAVWESNFSPVVVDDFVAVRAEFHEPIQGVEHEIVITPKMSFGTGHHATTRMMMQQMRQLDFNNKTVFDFGTGTGILAILAEKLSAADIIAIDYDEWCIINSTENTERNNCHNITLLQADTPDVISNTFHIILANINKNIILQFLPTLVNKLNKGAYMLLSGLLNEDEQEILASCRQLGLTHHSTITLNKWICIFLSA
jgi:ribosomal protein L11 methyltransferase